MNRFLTGLTKITVIILILALLFSLDRTAVRAEQLEDKSLTIAPLWYQPHLLSSIDEAVNMINNFKPLFSDWSGGEIQQLSADRSGMRFVAVITWTNTNTQWVPTYGGYFIGSAYVPYSSGYYQTTQTPQSSETRISIPANDIANLKLLHFPYLERDNKWGVDIRFGNGSNITLRTKTLDAAQKIIDSLATLAIAGGCKLPPPMGLVCQTENVVTEFTRLQYTGDKGVLVNNIFPGSPADQAGLLHDDIITEVNGQTVKDPVDFQNTVNKALENQPEVKFELQVFRDGQTISKSLNIKNIFYGSSISTSVLKPVAVNNAAPQSLGVSARNLTVEESQKAGLTENSGILINSVDTGSLAEQTGLKPGDYLLEINNQKITNVNILKQFLTSGVIIQDLKIWRNGLAIVLNGLNKF